jgi:glycosyltransferase involved in cell wall biosynthesis
VLEALACGAPVVATDLPTLREVGGAEVAFVPGDDVEAWARAAAPHLVSAPAEGERAGRSAHAARFSWEAQARAVRDGYAALAAGAREGAA